MTADCIVSEIETESHYIPFKCVQCGVSGFVEYTKKPRKFCNDLCGKHYRGASDKLIKLQQKAEAERIKASKPAPTEKTCSTCGQTKPVSEFSPDKKSKDGLRYCCKSCHRAACKKSMDRPGARERKAEYLRKKIKSDAAFREKRLQTKKLYNQKRRVVPNERVVVLHQAHVYAFMRLHLHSEHVSRWMAYRKEVAANTAKKRIVLHQAHVYEFMRLSLHSQHVKEYIARRKHKNLLHDAHVKTLRANENEYHKFRYKNDPRYFLKEKLSHWMKKHLKVKRDSRKWAQILGYTPEELRVHLEKQFTKGMSWENKGAWHIDHVVPVSSFNITSIDHPDFHACYGLQNLRPLWAKENIQKSNKMLFLL